MNARLLIMTSGGLGLCRPAPGTWGSVPPAALVLVVVWLTGQYLLANLLLLAVLALSATGCVILGRWAEEAFGGKDPSSVVIDEVAGMALSLLFLPLNPLESESALTPVIVIAAAFVLFRIIDIIKPPPANAMQQFPAGWGILLDDLVAGVYANVVMQLFLRLGLPALAGLNGVAA